MRSRWLTPRQSATSMTNKMNWTRNDLARRLLRVEEGLLEREATGVINDYDRKLVWSGYTLEERTGIVKSGISDWNNRLVTLKSMGGEPLFTG